MSYRQHQALSTRLVGGGLVALLHVAVIYALVTGLAHHVVEVVRAPIETKIIDETKPPAPESPPPAPQLAPPPLPAFVPPPEVRIETPPPPQSTAITAVTPEKPVEPPAPPAPAPAPAAEVRVLPQVDARHSHEPEYPPASARLGEHGSLILRVLVDTDGRATDAKLVQTCGFDRLDQAALDGIRRDYRFIPGTLDGKPTPMWYTFRFVWTLRHP
jgi:periplasmic protein TonB